MRSDLESRTTAENRLSAPKPAVLALLAVAVVFAWQFATVHFNYGGNWTGLFCIRPSMPVPAFLKSENLYLFQGTEGYDGQVYHLIAHDPWMRKGSPDAIVGAAFRYQRIFVPALAWVLAFGDDSRIHTAYFSVILLFVFLGVYWIARFAATAGRSPTWGLIFLLAPAAIVSIDRMTVDIALAALCAGFALYADRSIWKTSIILVCAALTRETALPMIAAYAIFLITRRRFAHAILAAATIIPAVAWHIAVSRLGPSDAPDYINLIPFAGFVERIIHPSSYAISPLKNALATGGDYLALAGVAIAFVLTVSLAARRRWNPRSSAIYALAIAAMLIGSRSVWEDVYAFGRVLTPWTLLLALEELRDRPWLGLAPMLCSTPRIGLNLASQVRGIAYGIAKKCC